MKNTFAITSFAAILVLGSAPSESGARRSERSLRAPSTLWSAHAKRRLRSPSRALAGKSVRRWGPALFRGRLRQHLRRVRRIAPGQILNALRRRVRATWNRMLARGKALSPTALGSLAKMNARVLGLLARLEARAGRERKSVLRELRRLSDRAKVLLRTTKPPPKRR